MTSVGLFTYSTKPRGSVVHACCLAEALTARGHDVTLYALSKAGDRLFRDLPCAVQYLRAEAAPSDPDQLIAQRIREVADGVRKLSPQHEVFHAEDCLVASGLLSLETRPRPIVRTLHHFEHFESSYLQECQRRSILEADAVACVSRVSQRDVRHELSRACPIIGNGVDFERFAGGNLRSWAREHFGVREGELVVLSVGGVEPRKNTLRAFEAMSQLLRQRPTARWLIAGGSSIWEHDAYRRDVAARLSALEPSVRARVVELGAVTERELTGLYQIAAVLLCPSLQEGFGLCVLEAMAAGAAVVVSAREPFTEYLDESSAVFVDPERVESIFSAVDQLASAPARRAELGRKGQARARGFGWDHVAREHERLYQSLLERRTLSSTHVYEDNAHA